MVVTIVEVRVKPEHVAAFIQATEQNHRASVLEPENRRFDVLQDPKDGGRFLLYEAYASQAGAAAHKETEHYQRWRSTVEVMMAGPRRGLPYKVLFPAEGA